MKKTRNGMRITGLLLTMVMLVALLGAFSLTASAAGGTAIDLSTLTETYVISDSGEYIFTGSGSHGIKVESGNPTIVLNDASIMVGEGSSIDVASGSNVTIFVLGDNTIGTTKTESSDAPCGGIFVAEGGTVNITSNGTDNILRAHGTLAAAIGGKYDYDNNESYNAGNINISNVTVYAYTNNFYASAIGAAGEGTCGTINITNAVVYVYGAGDQWTSAPGIGNAWSLLDWSDTIPIVIISDSEVHTFRYNPYSDYIGYLGDESGDTYATGSINCGEGGSVKSSTIYCYTGLDATTTDKVVKYGALGGLLKEDGTCEGEHSFTGNICDNCGYCSCTHEGGELTYAPTYDGSQHTYTCSLCGTTVTEAHNYHGSICIDCGHYDADATEVEIYDGYYSRVIIDDDYDVEKLTYYRELPNQEWNSLYVPFEIEVTDELLEDYEVAYMNNMHTYDADGDGSFEKMEMEIIKIKNGTLKANYPYFIRAKNTEAMDMNLVVENALVESTVGRTVSCQSVRSIFELRGIYERMRQVDFSEMHGTHYAISTEGGWWRAEGLDPFRAYLSVIPRSGTPVNAPAMRHISFRVVGDEENGENGETTDIENAEFTNQNSEIIYDLMGRRVLEPQKGGVYIVNGKKVVIK